MAKNASDTALLLYSYWVSRDYRQGYVIIKLYPIFGHPMRSYRAICELRQRRILWCPRNCGYLHNVCTKKGKVFSELPYPGYDWDGNYLYNPKTYASSPVRYNSGTKKPNDTSELKENSTVIEKTVNDLIADSLADD